MGRVERQQQQPPPRRAAVRSRLARARWQPRKWAYVCIELCMIRAEAVRENPQQKLCASAGVVIKQSRDDI